MRTNPGRDSVTAPVSRNALAFSWKDTRRHIQGALKAGATPEEIMTVLQFCVSLGIQACAKGVPILAEELEHSLS
jgi:alkylhydroperoxidase/carboxymuconolactone decarboxylase family protein YurZ